MTLSDHGRDVGSLAAPSLPEQEPAVVLRPRSASRALHDAPDARLCAGPDGLVLRRANGTTEVLAAPGTSFTARWQTEDQVLDMPRRRLTLRPAPEGPRLLLEPTQGGRALAVYEQDWTDNRPYARKGPPGWARELAAVLGAPLPGGRRRGRDPQVAAAPQGRLRVRRVHPDPLSRQRRWLQLVVGLLGVFPLTWSLPLSLVPGTFALQMVILALSHVLVVILLVLIGLLWLHGGRRVRRPLPRVTSELVPLGVAPSWHAARRLRLGARPGELVVRDECGAEASLSTTGMTWMRNEHSVRLVAPDGTGLLRLPLDVWAPDEDALVRLLDLLSEAGARPDEERPYEGAITDTPVPAPVHPVGGEVPGLPAENWYFLVTILNVWQATLLLTATVEPVVERTFGAANVLFWTDAQRAALVGFALAVAVAHRRRTPALSGGRMGGS